MQRTFLVRSLLPLQSKPKLIKIDPDAYTPRASPGTASMKIPCIPGGKGKSEEGFQDCFGLHRADEVLECVYCPINYECGAVMIASGNIFMGKEV